MYGDDNDEEFAPQSFDHFMYVFCGKPMFMLVQTDTTVWTTPRCDKPAGFYPAGELLMPTGSIVRRHGGEHDDHKLVPVEGGG